MMANHSDAFPEGSLTKEQLMSFFAISGESGNFKYSPGWERIPDNWYKRAIGDEYTIPGFLADVLDHAGKYPPFLNISGNTGSPNSFFTADLRSLTSGVFSGADLLDGNNLECFLLQVSQAPTPDSLGGAETQIGIKDQLLTPLRTTISERLGALACPKLDNIDKSQYNFFPGYNNCPDGCSGTSKCLLLFGLQWWIAMNSCSERLFVLYSNFRYCLLMCYLKDCLSASFLVEG